MDVSRTLVPVSYRAFILTPLPDSGKLFRLLMFGLESGPTECWS